MDLTKFPVFFPVSREFGSGDGFDCNCVRHHAFAQTQRFSRDTQKPCVLQGAREVSLSLHGGQERTLGVADPNSLALNSLFLGKRDYRVRDRFDFAICIDRRPKPTDVISTLTDFSPTASAKLTFHAVASLGGQSSRCLRSLCRQAFVNTNSNTARRRERDNGHLFKPGECA